jgi:hypothetical protein
MDRSNDNDSGAEIPMIAEQTSTIAELTKCLSQAYTVRGRIHMERGETDHALADLDDALRLDPGNADAHRLRGLIEGHPEQVVPSPTVHGQTEGDEPAIDAGLQAQHRFEAGYQVRARYPDNPGRDDDVLKMSFPLTPEGFLEAVEYARHMCSDESSRERGLLYDAYLTGGEQFDTVVTEFRSLVREIHLEKAIDDDGEPVID